MPHVLALVALGLVAAPPDLEPEHEANAIYRALIADGLDLGGTPIRFAAPLLRDGQGAEAQRKALDEFAGGRRAAEALLRDSVTAPFVLKVRDEATKAGDTIRLADLVFAVHADLDAIDPARAARESAGKAAEVANMKVETALLPPEALAAADIPPAVADREWYAHLKARMLDRVRAESTDHVLVTRAKDSLVVASRTDPRFGRPGAFPNAWAAIPRDGKPEGEAHPYLGGASYVKVSRLAGSPGLLVVESHFAFVEPKGWFDGAPILRSKFAPIAQDQIRKLRREIQARPR